MFLGFKTLVFGGVKKHTPGTQMTLVFTAKDPFFFQGLKIEDKQLPGINEMVNFTPPILLSFPPAIAAAIQCLEMSAPRRPKMVRKSWLFRDPDR